MDRESPEYFWVLAGLYFLLALGIGVWFVASSRLLIRGFVFLFILVSTQWMLFRWGRLLFPRQRQGSLLATSILFLNPISILLPWYGEKESMVVALTAAVALIGSKIRLRDGLKPPSVLLLSLLSGLGLSLSSFFLATLPWTLPSLWAAARNRRQALSWTAGAAIITFTTFLFGHYWPLIRFPAGIPDLSPSHPWNRILLAPVDHSPTVLTTQLALWVGLFGILIFFLILRVLAPRQPARFIRLAFLESLVIALAALFVQKIDGPFFCSLLPNLFLLLAWGCTSLTDMLRHRRRIPNALAEHPVAWGVGLLMVANIYWFWISR